MNFENKNFMKNKRDVDFLRNEKRLNYTDRKDNKRQDRETFGQKKMRNSLVSGLTYSKKTEDFSLNFRGRLNKNNQKQDQRHLSSDFKFDASRQGFHETAASHEKIMKNSNLSQMRSKNYGEGAKKSFIEKSPLRKTRRVFDTIDEFLNERETNLMKLAESTLSSTTVEIIQNPVKFSQLYKQKLDQDAINLSSDIDKFLKDIISLFDEVKRVLGTQLQRNALAFDEYITMLRMQCSRYLREANRVICEHKEKSRYKSLLTVKEDDPEEEELRQFREKNKENRAKEEIFFQIKNLREDMKIGKLTNNVTDKIESGEEMYNRKYLKNSIHNLKIEVVNHMENDSLFEWNKVIKKFSLRYDPNELLSTIGANSINQRMQNNKVNDSILGSIVQEDSILHFRNKVKKEKKNRIQVFDKKNKKKNLEDFRKKEVEKRSVDLQRRKHEELKYSSMKKSYNESQNYARSEKPESKVIRNLPQPKQSLPPDRVQNQNDDNMSVRSDKTSSTWNFIKSIYNGIVKPEDEVEEEKPKRNQSLNRRQQSIIQEVNEENEETASRGKLRSRRESDVMLKNEYKFDMMNRTTTKVKRNLNISSNNLPYKSFNELHIRKQKTEASRNFEDSPTQPKKAKRMSYLDRKARLLEKCPTAKKMQNIGFEEMKNSSDRRHKSPYIFQNTTSSSSNIKTFKQYGNLTMGNFRKQERRETSKESKPNKDTFRNSYSASKFQFRRFNNQNTTNH